MISQSQLDTLIDMFMMCDDDWLMQHITLTSIKRNNLIIVFDKVNYQDLEELNEQPL